MKYIRVAWIHEYPDEPVMYYCEIDDDRWPVRRVDVHRDGRLDYASKDEEAGTDLGEDRIPPLEEIAKDSEFEPAEITKDEFESMWANRTKRLSQPPSKERTTSRASRPRRSRPH